MNSIKISEVKINGQARRSTDENKVRELANSIKEIGLLNPITITSDKKLVAGLHRIKAFQLLNREEIPYSIIEIQDSLRIELAEIDENLIRNEITVLDQCNLFADRDRILSELGQKKPNHRPEKGANSAPLKTTKEIAKELGVSERTLQERKQITMLFSQ